MGIALLVCAIISIVFGAVWAMRAWEFVGSVVVAVVGVALLFMPFGSFLTIGGNLAVVMTAQRTIFARIASAPDDPPG